MAENEDDPSVLPPLSSLKEIILDVETTGLSPQKDRIVSIGCLELIGLTPTGEQREWLVNPEMVVPAESSRIHGLTNSDLDHQPPFAKILPQVWQFVHDSRLVIHNAPFDMGFLQAEWQRAGVDARALQALAVVDTVSLARKVLPKISGVSLDRLCDYYQVDRSSRHDYHGALKDCVLLASVYQELRGGRQRQLHLAQSQESQESPNGHRSQGENHHNNTAGIAFTPWPYGNQRPIVVRGQDCTGKETGEESPQPQGIS